MAAERYPAGMDMTTESQRIKFVSLAEECYLRIQNDILNGQLDWGTQLDVIHLAEKYGISRSPVVKAIDRLAHEGLVTVLPNKGSYVCRPTERDVIELTEVRMALEIMACELAYTKNREQLLRALDKNEHSVRRYEDAGMAIPFDIFRTYDRILHRTFVLLCDNKRFLDIFEINRNQVELSRTKSYSLPTYTQALIMHRRIIAALQQGQLEEAQHLLRIHIEESRDDMIGSLRNRGEAP